MCPECQCDDGAGDPAGRSSGGMTSAELGCFPQGNGQSLQRQIFRETDLTCHLILVPAMNLNRLKPYHTILMLYFTVN